MDQNLPVLDEREAVRWAYRLLLGREVENETVLDMQLQYEGGGRPDALRRRIVASPEFASCMRDVGLNVSPVSASIGPIAGMLGDKLTGIEGFFTDRFGVRTRVSSLAAGYHAYSGQVGSADGAFDMPLHEPEELNALLRSITSADRDFSVVELGAGWGPFIVLGAELARRQGLRISMMGVEGSSDHLAFMRTHLVDNGFDPKEHHLIHAVVGARDGVALFPKLSNPSNQWGGEAAFDVDQPTETEMEEVRCLSLPTLLDSMRLVDFLHCDIQGAEADVFETAITIVSRRVRRVCIGTHGRHIEARLFDLFPKHGWILEAERPCPLSQDESGLFTIGDGVQVWRNGQTLSQK